MSCEGYITPALRWALITIAESQGISGMEGISLQPGVLGGKHLAGMQTENRSTGALR